LKAHEIQSPEMVTAAKPSSQPRTESCVVATMALRSVDREVVGRNVSERKDNPEIDRGRSSRPYPSTGKAETRAATRQVTWDASGVRTAGMQPKDFMGTRESRQVQASLVGSDKPTKRGRPEDLAAVRLADSTRRSGEPATWGSGQRKDFVRRKHGLHSTGGFGLLCNEKNRQPWKQDSNE
jgi:hypothetical protein